MTDGTAVYCCHCTGSSLYTHVQVHARQLRFAVWWLLETALFSKSVQSCMFHVFIFHVCFMYDTDFCNLMMVGNVLIFSKQNSMTITLAPGYLLSRTKEKINVTITDDFFKEGNTKVSWLFKCTILIAFIHSLVNLTVEYVVVKN